MKTTKISVPWKEGLHMRPAAAVVRCARKFKSSINLKVNGRLADAQSIFALMVLAANFGTVMDLEVNGVDEAEACAAITEIFESNDDGQVSVDRNKLDQQPKG